MSSSLPPAAPGTVGNVPVTDFRFSSQRTDSHHLPSNGTLLTLCTLTDVIYGHTTSLLVGTGADRRLREESGLPRVTHIDRAGPSLVGV